jgi:hypothetical protein
VCSLGFDWEFFVSIFQFFVLCGHLAVKIFMIEIVLIYLILGRKKSPLDPSCCPVCGITLRSSDLEVHFVQELERLERVSRTFRSSSHHHHHHHGSSGGSSISPSGSSGAMSAPAATSQVQKREQDTRWEVIKQILKFQ